MSKQSKPKIEERRVGPKFARNVIPESFQIRRPVSPMADLLDEAARGGSAEKSREATPVDFTGVDSTGVKNTGVSPAAIIPAAAPARHARPLPSLDKFLDDVLPLFPPARQVLLLRLYRWSEGTERDLVVSTPRLAAKTNMDEKACRMHLHALISEGFLVRTQDGEHIAKFGGSDRGSRGLLLSLSGSAFEELIGRSAR